MKVTPTALPGVLVVEPKEWREPRGWLFEAYSSERYAAAGMPAHFAQDNVSRSVPGVLRGLHFQFPIGQGKLVSIVEGEVLDVAVDVRPDSPTFGKWVAEALSAENHKQLWIPEGFAHGFIARKTSVMVYKMSTPYDPQGQRSVLWSDEAIGIDWGAANPLLSEKDAKAPRLREYAHDALPHSSGRSGPRPQV
jgi:dTDP-4-dehydrorhamnose 3,5-epimerase